MLAIRVLRTGCSAAGVGWGYVSSRLRAVSSAWYLNGRTFHGVGAGFSSREPPSSAGAGCGRVSRSRGRSQVGRTPAAAPCQPGEVTWRTGSPKFAAAGGTLHRGWRQNIDVLRAVIKAPRGKTTSTSCWASRVAPPARTARTSGQLPKSLRHQGAGGDLQCINCSRIATERIHRVRRSSFAASSAGKLCR